MNTFEPKYVNQSKAATLLGMTEKELCRISRESGYGHKELDLCELTTQTVN